MKNLYIMFFMVLSALKSQGQCTPPIVNDVSNSCNSGNTLTLRAVTVNAGNGATHRWYTSESEMYYITGNVIATGYILITEVEVDGTESYWVSTKKSGCESIRKKITATFTPNTVPDFYIPNVGGKCSPSPTFNLTVYGGGSGSTFEWYNSDEEGYGTLLHTGHTYSPTVNYTTTFYVGGTLMSSLGCPEPITTRRPVTVTVKSSPVSPSASNKSRCGAGTVTFIAGGVSGASYRWYTVSGSYLAEGDSYITPNLTTTTNYQVKSYKNGCFSTAKTVTATIITTFPPPPIVNDVSNSCNSGNTLTLRAVTIDAGNDATHRWYTSESEMYYITGNVIATGYTLITEVEVDGTESYWVSTKKSLGCESVRKKITATFAPNTVPDFYIPNVPERCSSLPSFNLIVYGGGSGSTFEWYNSDEEGYGTLLHTGRTYSPTVNYTTTFYVGGTLMSSLGCPEPITTRRPVTVTVKPSPISPTVTVRCSLNTVTLTASGVSGAAYRWYALSGNYLAEGNSYTTPNLTITTNYQVRAYKNDCLSTARIVTIEGMCDKNYIISRNILHAGVKSSNQIDALPASNIIESISYFDGLGRPIQSVQTGQSPQGYDIVQPIAYDEYGRETKQYLPYVVENEASGIFKENALASPSNTDPDPLIQYQSGMQYNFYQTATNIAHDPTPYAERIFEPSPLNRVMEQGAPGVAWQPVADTPSAGKTIKFSYEINTVEDAIYQWFINAEDRWPSKAAEGGYYPTGELYKNVTTDEEGNRVIEFVDKLQRTILKRVQAVNSPNLSLYVAGEWADTYYIYDDFGNLRFVLPPEAIANIEDFGN